MHKMRACNFCLCTYIGVRGLRAGRVRAREKNFGGPRCDGSAAATTDRTLTSFASGILPLPPSSLPSSLFPPPLAPHSHVPLRNCRNCRIADKGRIMRKLETGAQRACAGGRASLARYGTSGSSSTV